VLFRAWAPLRRSQIYMNNRASQSKSKREGGKLALRERMARIKKTNTKPEIAVRKLLFACGYRYSIHRRNLPGTPDIVFPKRKKVVLVHGCFWHRHHCPAGRKMPKSNLDYWRPKLERNKSRDLKNRSDLKALGWTTFTVWECELSDLKSLERRLIKFLQPPARDATRVRTR
jgi:DNA mismatch endonuclease (patch repair protein)